MNFEGEADAVAGNLQQLDFEEYSDDGEDSNEDGEEFYDDGGIDDHDMGKWEFYNLRTVPGIGQRWVDTWTGVARVPVILLHSTAALLRRNESLPRAWMLAIAEQFPDTSLEELRSKSPSLLPPWLLRNFTAIQVRTAQKHLFLGVRVSKGSIEEAMDICWPLKHGCAGLTSVTSHNDGIKSSAMSAALTNLVISSTICDPQKVGRIRPLRVWHIAYSSVISLKTPVAEVLFRFPVRCPNLYFEPM